MHNSVSDTTQVEKWLRNECKPIDLSISNPFQRPGAPFTLQDDKISGTPRAWSEDFDIKASVSRETWNFPGCFAEQTGCMIAANSGRLSAGNCARPAGALAVNALERALAGTSKG